MNKDLHHIDDLFRSMLEGHEEMPSQGLKESIDAALAEKEAEGYKKRFILWKRVALILSLMLLGFILYDAVIERRTRGNTNKISINKPETGYQQETIHPNSDNTHNARQNIHSDNQSDSLFEKEEIVIPVNSLPSNKKTTPVDIEKAFTFFSATPSTKEKTLSDPIDYQSSFYSQTHKRNGEVHERINFANISSVYNQNLPHSLSINSIILSSAGNDNTLKGKFNPFWFISLYTSYDQAGYKLESEEPSAINSIKFREAQEPSYSAGFLMGRQLTGHLGLQSGIIHRNTAIGMKPQKTYAFVDPTGDIAYKYITSAGYAFIKPEFGPQPLIGDSLTTAEAKHTMKNISIPLVARYSVGKKKITFIPAIGIEANFITEANIEVDIEDPSNHEVTYIRKLSGTKKFYWSFVANAEIKYNLSKKISVSGGPVYRSAISPITKNNVVQTYPHSIGIGGAVTYKF